MERGPAAPNAHLPKARFSIPKHVASRAFPTETVLLNLQTGQYHGLNPTGGRMFEVLGECGDFEEAVTLLTSEFEQPHEIVGDDLQELCASLIQRGLLETGPA